MNPPTRACQYCQHPLTGRSDRRYCSNTCRALAWAKRKFAPPVRRKKSRTLPHLLLLLLLGGWMPHGWAASGFATYYTKLSCRREGTSGSYTANGEVYDEMGLTCALPHHEFGGLYRVCRGDLSGAGRGEGAQARRCVVVRVNDLGPSQRIVHTRRVIIDLTPTAFKHLAPLSKGKIWVTVEKAVTVEALP